MRVAVTLLAVAALAACGDDDDGGTEATPTTQSSATTTTAAASDATTTTAGAAGGATVDVGTTSLGDVLVDADGLTLYVFNSDTTPGESACNAGCVDIWPPVTVDGTPTAGADVTAELATITRDDGKRQVTVAGKPLYRFSGDAKAGDTNGQGVIDMWYVVSPAGEKIES
jgi:predicted lipoprotein with Yx(FWY)xxD motif